MEQVAMVSLNNGLSYKDVAELTAAEMALIADYVDAEVSAELGDADAHSAREWTGAYLLAHRAKFGEWLVIG